jgi:hypothetical protein
MMRALVLVLVLVVPVGAEIRLAPDGTFVQGQPNLAPDGTFVGGRPEIAPDGSFVGTGRDYDDDIRLPPPGNGSEYYERQLWPR